MPSYEEVMSGCGQPNLKKCPLCGARMVFEASGPITRFGDTGSYYNFTIRHEDRWYGEYREECKNEIFGSGHFSLFTTAKYDYNNFIKRWNDHVDELEKQNESLKSCPFCGGKAKMHPRVKNGSFYIYIKCENENCGAETFEKEFNKREAAIEKWNRRGEG